MKLRLIAVSLILLTAAWLPIIAQQSATQPPAKRDQPATCCHGKDGSASSMPCCQGKDAKDMPCCQKDGQDQQAAVSCCDSKAGKDCCKKDAHAKNASYCNGRNAKICAKLSGKDCCNTADCQSCCDRRATTASDTDPDAKSCCAAKDPACCHSKSNA